MNKSLLGKSIENFEEKKAQCLKLLESLMQEKEAFDKVFPSSENTEKERLSHTKLHALKERLKSAQLKILIAGQFNTGKSTLLNAILGAVVLPEDVAPCTAVITEIEYGEKAEATLYFKDSLNVEKLPSSLKPEILEHICKYLPEAAPPFVLEKVNSETLSDYLSIPLGMEHIEGVRESPYARCSLKWPLELCKGGALLIDSPGLNEHESRDAITRAYMDEADMILHVLSANQPCGMPDKKFIEEVRMRGNEAFPIIFAVNRFDQLRNEEQREKIRNYVRGLKELIGPYGQDGIFFTAALKGIEGRLEDNPEKVREAGIIELEEMIGEIFEEDRFRIKLAAICEAANDLQEFNNSLQSLDLLLKQDSKALQKAFNENQKEFQHLENEILRIRNKAERVADRYEKEFRFALSEFFNSFCDNILPEIVRQMELPEITLLNRKEASKLALELLNDRLNTALGENFTRWLYTEGTKLEQACLREIKEDIQDNLQEFADILGKVRDNLHPDHMTGAKESNIELLDFMPDALAGAGVGGAVGYAAVFIASRFLPVIAGPAGWVFVAVTSVLMAVVALATGSDGREKVKKDFIARTQVALRAQSANNVSEIARAASLKFREGLLNLYLGLEEKISDVRKPLESAIHAIEEKTLKLDEKQKLLRVYQEKFQQLHLEAKKICESL